MRVKPICKEIISRMGLELKRQMYAHFLTIKEPTCGEIEMGFALVCDEEIQKFISEKLKSGV